VTWGQELERLSGAEGGHVVLGLFVAYTLRQMRAVLSTVRLLWDRIAELAKRLDEVEAGRLDPMVERINGIVERIDHLHPQESPPPGVG
jgi:CBS domain containing-hemolysin-like protein